MVCYMKIYDGENHYVISVSEYQFGKHCTFVFLFDLCFMCRTLVPFRATQHICNSWNENKKVQYSKDGQVRFLMNL